MRALVTETVESYADFIEAHAALLRLSKDGKAPKQDMPSAQFDRGIFYSAVIDNASIVTQWVEGNYAKAEMSFLQINRSGERLSPFEQLLIEFRNGPYARVVSSIVSAGKAGHFWPEEGLGDEAATTAKKFSDLASTIHDILFLPPHVVGEVRNMNLPLVISKPGDRYEDCLELVALVADNILLYDDEAKKQILEKNDGSDAREIISIGWKLFKIVVERLSQLVGGSTNPKSIAIGPLVYTYSHQGMYSKNLLYGLLYWLFSGGDEDVQTKKIALSANRGRFESILLMCKADITAIASRKGGGFKSTKDIAETISQIVEKLTQRGDLNADQAIESVMSDLSLKPSQPHITYGRTASRRQRSQINISTPLEHAPMCEICKGYLNLESGKQYDHHFEKFARVRRTSTENMRPVHPFCNNMHDQIDKVKGHASELLIPNLPAVPLDVMFDKRQLSLDF